MTTPEQIVRCLKRDMDGDLLAGARYADRIAAAATANPWSQAEDSVNYAEAARRLRAEHAEEERRLTLEALYR